MTVDYIQQYHVTGISWHTTLNNHASTRPKAYGGKLVDSLTERKAFEQSLGSAPVSDSATWRCRLVLPNSFVLGDGRVLQATGEGGTQYEASENERARLCQRSRAELVFNGLSQSAASS